MYFIVFLIFKLVFMVLFTFSKIAVCVKERGARLDRYST